MDNHFKMVFCSNLRSNLFKTSASFTRPHNKSSHVAVLYLYKKAVFKNGWYYNQKKQAILTGVLTLKGSKDDIPMKNQLIDLIVKKLDENKKRLKNEFFLEHPIKVARHFVLDHLLPTDIAEKIHANFPKPNKMGLLHSYGELKLKYSHIKNTSSLLQDLHFAIQNPRVVAAIEDITEIKNQVPDTSRLAGGVSALLKGHYINPHLDNSHDVEKKLYRTVNLLYY